jgi:hypothetical protein
MSEANTGAEESEISRKPLSDNLINLAYNSS